MFIHQHIETQKSPIGSCGHQCELYCFFPVSLVLQLTLNTTIPKSLSCEVQITAAAYSDNVVVSTGNKTKSSQNLKVDWYQITRNVQHACSSPAWMSQPGEFCVRPSLKSAQTVCELTLSEPKITPTLLLYTVKINEIIQSHLNWNILWTIRPVDYPEQQRYCFGKNFSNVLFLYCAYFKLNVIHHHCIWVAADVWDSPNYLHGKVRGKLILKFGGTDPLNSLSNTSNTVKMYLVLSLYLHFQPGLYYYLLLSCNNITDKSQSLSADGSFSCHGEWSVAMHASSAAIMLLFHP